MLASKMHEFCEQLNEYLKVKFKYKKSHAYLDPFGNIRALTKKFDLDLRLKADNYWPTKTLVISRIGFLQQRAYNGKDLLIFLNQLCIEHGFRNIAIECANPNSAAFALRYGFRQFKIRDYIVECRELIHNFGTIIS